MLSPILDADGAIEDGRQRISAAPEYIQALGQAHYSFACLEWGVVYIINSFKIGYLHEYKKKTSNDIATEFYKFTKNSDIRVSETKHKLLNLARQFKVLVDLRNDLNHVHPDISLDNPTLTLPVGPHRRGVDWSIRDLYAAASEFENCALDAWQIFRECSSKEVARLLVETEGV